MDAPEPQSAVPPAAALDAALAPSPWWQRLRDWVWAYDFFISYQWSSGGRYAAALANRLREPPEPCDVMLDAAEFTAGNDWRTQAGAALRNTRRLILIGTRGALEESLPVAEEVATFTRRSRLIIPVVFDEEIVRQPRAGHRVLGAIPDDAIFVVEDPETLSRGPSDEAVAAIKRTHRLLRRRSLRARLLVATVMLVGGTATFGGWVAFARWQAFQRNVDATSAVLARADAALATDDPASADTLLAEADRRLCDGVTNGLRSRAAELRADLGRLRELMAIEEASWEVVDGDLPAVADVNRRYEDFLARHVESLATGQPDLVASRIARSAIKEQLIATLDLLLAQRSEQAAAAVAVAAQLDGDPYRGRLRRALADADADAVGKLLAEPRLLDQQPRFLLAVALSPLLPGETRRSILLDAWRRHPGDYGILMRLGTSYGGDWNGSGTTAAERTARISFFRAALAVRPGSVAAWNDLAGALFDVGLTAEALAAAETAIKLDPTDPLPRVNAVAACSMLGDVDAAERHAREAVALGAGVASTHNALATVLLNLRQDAAGAVASMRTAVALAPGVPALHANLGHALLASGSRHDALAAFRAAAEAEPDSPDYWLLLGFEAFAGQDEGVAMQGFRRGMAALGNSADRPQLLRDLLDRIESGDLAVMASAAALAEGASREAIAIVDRGLEVDPENAWLHHNRSEALIATGDIRAALESCRTAVRLAPTFAVAWNNLGLALLECDELEEAGAALTEAVRLDPASARAHLNLGNCRIRQGDVRAALGAYEEAVHHDPGYVKAWLNLSVARRDTGDIAGAVEAAERASALAPGEPGLRQHLELLRSRERSDADVR